MVILVKIVKIGQLQMPVETRDPIVHLGFFRLKHTYIIGKQKNSIWKVSYGKKFTSDHSEMYTKYASAGWAQTIKKFLSHTGIPRI